MTVLIVLIGLLVSHFFTVVGRWRDFGWLLAPVARVRRQWPGQGAAVVVTVVITALVVSVLASLIATTLLGVFGWFLLATATFIYTLGPRDLDHDVERVIEHPGHADARDASEALGLAADASAAEAGAAALHAARTRWFAILFWFVLLGIPGAILYRLCQKAMKIEDLDESSLDWLARMRWVLEWPVLGLMIFSAGLVADLDGVVRAWKHYHRERPWWLLSPRLLDDVTASLIDAGTREEGLRRGHQLAWRMLVLWLVVMSVMLIGGWIV
jgi:AmpE protein